MVRLGKVQSFIDESVVVKSESEAILDLDNVVFVRSEGSETPYPDILGTIEDVFGKVEEAFYLIKIDPYT